MKPSPICLEIYLFIQTQHLLIGKNQLLRPWWFLLLFFLHTALTYSEALCKQKCKRSGTIESHYCLSNFGKKNKTCKSYLVHIFGFVYLFILTIRLTHTRPQRPKQILTEDFPPLPPSLLYLTLYLKVHVLLPNPTSSRRSMALWGMSWYPAVVLSQCWQERLSRLPWGNTACSPPSPSPTCTRREPCPSSRPGRAWALKS